MTIERRERGFEAARMRAIGHTWAEVAAHLGVAATTARTAVNEASKQWLADAVEVQGRYRLRQCAQLNAVLAAVLPQALAGDLPAVDRVVRVLARQATLLGLDAPARVESESRQEHIYTVSDSALVALLAQAGHTVTVDALTAPADARGRLLGPPAHVPAEFDVPRNGFDGRHQERRWRQGAGPGCQQAPPHSDRTEPHGRPPVQQHPAMNPLLPDAIASNPLICEDLSGGSDKPPGAGG